MSCYSKNWALVRGRKVCQLAICLYCKAQVTQLPGTKSGCTVYCGLQAVECGFPVFVMVETEQKGVSRLWSLMLSKISPQRVGLTVLSLSFVLPPYFLCAPEVSSTRRNNTNLFTRLGNAECWRVEINRNRTEKKKTRKLHQVGHDVWVHYKGQFCFVFLGQPNRFFNVKW